MSRYYFAYNDYLKKTFPFKVYKIPLDAGFTCPNRDGTRGYGGCTYCENKSFSPNSQGERHRISDQIARGIAFYKARRNAEKFIAYFQAYTNTYAPVNHLKALYDEALSFPEVVGLSIGTRPDCVPDEVLDLLSDYARRTHLWVEFGLQTIHDPTLDWVHRGHTFAQFEDAVRRTKSRGLPICVHVILGFPGETREMMLRTAETLAELGIDGIKIHHLYVAKQTLMEKSYRRGEVPVMGLEKYIPLVCDFLERIPARVAVQRLMGELDGAYLIAPRWGKRKREILAAIESEFQRRGTRQGSSASEEPAWIAAAP